MSIGQTVVSENGMSERLNNAFKELPELMPHTILKAQGVSVDTIIGSKLLKIKVKDFIKQEQSITNETIKDASVLCKCECSNYCIFPVHELLDPDVLPACSECNFELDSYIWEQSQHGRTLNRLEAWAENGVVRNEIQYSRVFMNFTDRSNSILRLKGHQNKKMSQFEMENYGVNKRNFMSVIQGRNPELSTKDNILVNYQCLCERICVFDQSVYKSLEPIGMCSACAHELQYSLKRSDLKASTQQLTFKIIWKDFLEEHGYPYMTFKTTWIAYISARKLSRKNYIELHFKDFLKDYDFSKVKPDPTP